jgi:hypothetical protein
MNAHMIEMLARARMAEVSRASGRRSRIRSSLQILLDVRRAREQSLVR